MTITEATDLLKQQANAIYLAGMSRFGINTTTALGIPVPKIRTIAKLIKKDHTLAQQLWDTNIHEARLLAIMIADPGLGHTATDGQFGKGSDFLGSMRPGLR